jgi:hypothetical protein
MWSGPADAGHRPIEHLRGDLALDDSSALVRSRLRKALSVAGMIMAASYVIRSDSKRQQIRR